MQNEFDNIEKNLLSKVSANDVKAFEELYNTYHPFIYKFVLSFLKSPEMTEDIVQEIFVKVWDIRPELVKVESFPAYIRAMVRNHVLNFLKKNLKEKAAKIEILKHYKNTNPDSIEQELMTKEYFSFIQQVLNSLPAQTREVFRLSREENKSYEEIAAELGITRHTVKKHIVRSNKEFRDSLRNFADFKLALLVFILYNS